MSCKGQGGYRDPELDIDGRRRTVRGYTTDILTGEALRASPCWPTRPAWSRPARSCASWCATSTFAPTVLELAGVPRPAGMDGRSFAPLLRGERQERGSELLYEYCWEHAFPHTPTVLALRDARFKDIFYHGLWDTDELYDLAADPRERSNLIGAPEHAARAAAMKKRMWQLLDQTGGMHIPLKPAGSWQAAERRPAGARPPVRP